MSQLMESAVRVAHTAFVSRWESLFPAVPLLFEGEQSAATDYAVFTDDDELEGDAPDHDAESVEVVKGISMHGAHPLTLMNRAVILAESLKNTPLVVAGFYHLETICEVNHGRPIITPVGQANQYARDLRFRFHLHPNPS